MTDTGVDGADVRGPICPNCRQLIRDQLLQEEITPTPSNRMLAPVLTTVLFCGGCGWIFDVAPRSAPFPGSVATGPAVLEVQGPTDENSLEGQFQIRCRELVTETRGLGFNPNVWVPMINTLGAVGAAKKLLEDRHVLVATPWLVTRGHSDLTLEHEIAQARWTELFTDADRFEATRRLAAAGGPGTD